ncbi:MAG: hypothetical protein OXT65_05885 [Alphaproteobacteria bacterium]|nr:hypothetical protein [Alphaproteobacteria bacterium]
MLDYQTCEEVTGVMSDAQYKTYKHTAITLMSAGFLAAAFIAGMAMNVGVSQETQDLQNKASVSERAP